MHCGEKNRDTLTQLKKDVSNLTNKSKKHDCLTTQGLRNILQMDNFVDYENIR